MPEMPGKHENHRVYQGGRYYRADKVKSLQNELVEKELGHHDEKFIEKEGSVFYR